MTRWAFYVDTAACSGCKACQVACKDRNALPLGVAWRRVYEVVDGGWRKEGEAWIHDVTAWNLSVACNHCERPIGQEVCPSGAITVRMDGVVLLDGDRCLGCGYCAWACPWGAPQYDAAAGRMTKCDFCADELDAGRSPVCVAACPLRALDFGDLEELTRRHGPLPTVHPLPAEELTRPALCMTAHPAADGGRVANREEVRLDG
jgi:anaerobic dimethyl sulfoxide reductase subunit B (iron-sulfur subunit)